MPALRGWLAAQEQGETPSVCTLAITSMERMVTPIPRVFLGSWWMPGRGSKSEEDRTIQIGAHDGFPWVWSPTGAASGQSSCLFSRVQGGRPPQRSAGTLISATVRNGSGFRFVGGGVHRVQAWRLEWSGTPRFTRPQTPSLVPPLYEGREIQGPDVQFTDPETEGDAGHQ